MSFRLTNKQGFRWLTIAAIAFFVLTLGLTLHRHFTFYSSYDQGIFNQVFWNGIHGNFFQSTLSSQLSTNVVHNGEIPQVNYHRLGQHFTPALLLWLPIYFLFPTPATLTVLQAVFITSAGLVLYALARIYLEPAIALLITISFYCANAVLGPSLANFHDISQIPLFVFSLLLAMEKRCWWLFWVLAICILAVREDSGITLFGVGVYLVISRRYPKIGLGVCGLSFAYMLALTNIIMPLFSDDISRRFMLERFGQFASGESASTLDIIWGMVSNPWRFFVELFTPVGKTINYLLGQWLPLAFVPVFAPASWAIAGFPLLKLLLGKGQSVLSISIRYAMSVTPGLFYGAVLWWAGQGFANFNSHLSSCKPRKLSSKFRQLWVFCLCLSLIFTITSNPSWTLYFLIPNSIQPWVHVSAPQQWQRVPAIRSLLKSIPDNASVSATTNLIPHLSSRREIIRLPRLKLTNDQNQTIKVDYLIADLGHLDRYQIAFKEERLQLESINRLLGDLIQQNQYGVIGFEEGVILCKKEASSQSQSLEIWQKYRDKVNK